MNMTLEWLISSNELNNLKCIAASEHLNNIITSVNILDNPDVLKWIKKDELVLTTGYIFKDDPDLQISIIRELKAIGCAGLCIKIKRFFYSVPDAMIEEAEKIGLPLIELPFYYAFSEISRLIYNELYSRQLNNIQAEYDAVKTISEMFFENLGLDAMLKELSRFMNKSVIITDLEYTCLSLAMTDAYSHVLNDEVTAVEISPFSSSSYISTQGASENMFKYLMMNGHTFQFFITTLPNFMGYFCVLIDETELDPSYKVLVQKIIHIIALELERSKGLKKNVQYYPNFFFDFLISEQNKTEEEIKVLCHLYGFDYKSKRVCLTLTLQNYENDYHKKQMIKVLHDHISKFLSKNKNYFICANHDIISTFLFYPEEHKNILAVNYAFKTAGQLYLEIKNLVSCDVRIGISRCHKRITTISMAFKDSMKAIQLEELLGSSQPISSYNNQLPYHILCELPKPDLEKIYKDSIAMLVEFDKQNHTELVATFKMYYECKFNSSEAAKRLFLHRNTLLYRLDKIKELLETDFNNPNEFFSLYLGICALELLI